VLIGAMNHPGRDPVAEMAWMRDLGLDFVDLTLEPPGAASWQVDPERLRAGLERHGLQAVGHTAYYLPLGSPFEEVRQGAVTELRRCLRVFARLGVRWMNVHPDRTPPMHDRAFVIGRNLASLRELAEDAAELGVGLMIENLPGEYNDAAQLGDLLAPLPWLGLHLDVGHANLLVARSTTADILAAWGDRLRHVHLHDNRGGGADLHLPLGAGTVDVEAAVRALQALGYDGTITLEVFTPDRGHLAYSAERLRAAWRAAREERAVAPEV
jgi:sugar phosphate isomerase/epimerase